MMDKGSVDKAADALRRARARTLQIGARIGELRASSGAADEPGGVQGSTPEQAESAAHHALLAMDRAADAAQRRLSAHEHAALAHDRAAEAYEEMSAEHVAECPERPAPPWTGVDRDGPLRDVPYRERARLHRGWAEADRAAARALRGPEVSEVTSGTVPPEVPGATAPDETASPGAVDLAAPRPDMSGPAGAAMAEAATAAPAGSADAAQPGTPRAAARQRAHGPAERARIGDD